MLNRRTFGLALLSAGTLIGRAEAGDVVPQMKALEASLGGRMGVAALDTRTGRRIAHRADERFAMCSTFKWLLAAAVLSRSERGGMPLDRLLTFSEADLLSHSPVTRAHVREGAMRIADLCAAAVEESDNGAANALLRTIGGPSAVTAYARSVGDRVTRLDRMEPGLNENRPHDPRDTTTPDATVNTMRRILLGHALTPASRALLIGWMRNCRTGLDRLRAGLPREWVAADKTGTGGGVRDTNYGPQSAANDIAVAWPPSRPPILIASYISDASASAARQSAALAEIARIIAATFG